MKNSDLMVLFELLKLKYDFIKAGLQSYVGWFTPMMAFISTIFAAAYYARAEFESDKVLYFTVLIGISTFFITMIASSVHSMMQVSDVEEDIDKLKSKISDMPEIDMNEARHLRRTILFGTIALGTSFMLWLIFMGALYSA